MTRIDSQLDVNRIRSELAELAIGLRYFDEIHSTNDWALKNVEPIDTPIVVLTEQQTAGRGQQSNRWHSSSGSLTFSLVTHVPIEPAERRGLFPLTIGLACCESLGGWAEEKIQVKWPNDLILDDRKIGGILIEALDGQKDIFVVGIGINVNNRLSETFAETELQQRAGRLKMEGKENLDMTALFLRLISDLTLAVAAFKNLNLDEFRAQFAERDWLRGQNVELTTPQGIRSGEYLGIGTDGTAQLSENGQVTSVHSGQMRPFSS